MLMFVLGVVVGGTIGLLISALCMAGKTDVNLIWNENRNEEDGI